MGLQEADCPFGIAVAVHTLWETHTVAGKELLVAIVACGVVACTAYDGFAALFGKYFTTHGAVAFGCST